MGGTLPSFREYTSVVWESKSGTYTASLSNIYIPSVVAFADLTTKVGSYTQFDTQASVDLGRVMPALKGLKFTAGINNIFNKYPPVDPQDFTDPPADSGIYGSFGRFYYTEFTFKF